MDNVHDVGGLTGFGPVVREENEPVFHEPWEGRIFALCGAMLNELAVDEYRWAIERMKPVDYLTASYYEKWVIALEQALERHGLVTPEELEAKQKELA
jgi:nitrile hydratase